MAGDKSGVPFDPTVTSSRPEVGEDFKIVEARYGEIKKELKNADGFWEVLPPVEMGGEDVVRGKTDAVTTPGYNFQKEETPYSEAYQDFGTDKYFNYLFYLRDFRGKDDSSEVLKDVREGRAKMELHLGKKQDVVGCLQEQGYEVSEHTSANTSSHPYADQHYRLYICHKPGEIKYVVSSVYEQRLGQLESVLGKSGIKPEKVTGVDHKLDIAGEYRRIFDKLKENGLGSDTLVMGARHGIVNSLRLNCLLEGATGLESGDLDVLKVDEYLAEQKGLVTSGEKSELVEYLDAYLEKNGSRAEEWQHNIRICLNRSKVSAQDRAKFEYFLDTYQFKQFSKAVATRGAGLFDAINLRTIIEWDEWVEKWAIKYPNEGWIRRFRVLGDANVGEGYYDEDFGRFDSVKVGGARKLLTSIPYGVNAMHLALEAQAHGATNFYLSGSVGGINTHDKTIHVGDLVVPTVFLDKGGKTKGVAIKNFFSGLSGREGIVQDCRQRVVGHITEEDRSWLVDQVETGVNLVDVELGLVPFTTDIGESSKKDKAKLGVIGVVTDVPNKESFHKLKTEISEKEKIAQACAARDGLILEAMTKDHAPAFSLVEESWFGGEEQGERLPDKLVALKREDLRKYTGVRRMYLSMLAEADLHNNDKMSSLLASLALEKWENQRVRDSTERALADTKKSRLTNMYKGERAKEMFADMRKDQLEHPELGAIVVVRMDADAFKQINDILSHDAGDKQLIDIGLSLREEFAKIFGQQSRATDVIVHYSGDEFGMIFSGVREYTDPETGITVTIQQAAENVIARIIKKVEKTVRRPAGVPGDFQTMSVGYKIIQPGDEVVEFEELDKKADGASNIAKCLRGLKREGDIDFSLGQNRIINFDKIDETLERLGVSKEELAVLEFERALVRPVGDLSERLSLDPAVEGEIRSKLVEVIELAKASAKKKV